MIQQSNKKKKHHKRNYVSIAEINDDEQFIKLSKPCNGNVGNIDTLLQVLAKYNQSQDIKSNKNSRFIDTLYLYRQNCILILENLNDVLSKNDQHSSEMELIQEIMCIQKDLKQNVPNKIIKKLKIKLGKVHDVDAKYIQINDIYYGSAHIDYSIITKFNKRGNMSDTLKNQFKSYKDLKLHPLFFEESFSIKDFDQNGHTDFTSSSQKYDIGPKNNTRKYIQPSGWTRYGLKVLDGRYGTNNSWLHPFQDNNNWYRAYHGTAASSGKLILNGNGNKAFFKKGPGQGCKNHQAHCGGIVGDGVYCTPNPTMAESYSNKGYVTIQTTQGQKSYKFMFQVCVNPNVVRMSTSSTDIWVVPDGKTIDAMRPYGILLKQV